MTTNSPTCVLSGPCLLGPQGPQRVSTISSEVENSPFYCDQCLYLQDESSPTSDSHNPCCPVTGILPTIASSENNADDEPIQPTFSQHQPHTSPTPHHSSNPSTPTFKSSKSGKSSGWKTSKFFSKTMSSGEILRGLKKLSLTGSSSDPMEVESPKPRKSKSAQLKKRSSYGNEEVTVEVEALAFGTTKNVMSSALPVLSKALSLVETGTCSKTSNPGIVCKKEDLKAILCSATSNTISKKISSASPTRRTRAPLRQTKSASFEPIPKKDPIRRTGSEETRCRRNLFVENNEDFKKSKDHGPEVNNLRPPEEPTREILLVENLNMRNRNMNESPTLAQQQTSSEGSLSAVKWDECEVVDAVLIGDAIETFLKVSMSGSEKRVSFRRNSTDKKAKSDG